MTTDTTNGATTVRDFDAARQARAAKLSFTIGGETFRMRPVRPEKLLAYQEIQDRPSPELLQARRDVLRASIDFPSVNGQQSAEATLAAMEAAPLEEDFERETTAKLLPRLDEIVTDLLDPADDAHARYRKLRERETDPLTLGDVQSLVSWMLASQSKELEVETGRPTGPPSSSGRGPGRTGASSMVGSSLPAPPSGPMG